MSHTRWFFPITRTAAILFALAMFANNLSAAGWKEKVLYSFQGGTDGQLPVGSIVFDSAGNLYGATTQGGATNCSPLADCGTVFQLTPPAKTGDPWTETVLYIFKGAEYKDGDEPAGGLVIDSQGNLYGTTAYGGTGNCVLLGVKGGCGTVYELSPPSEKGGAWTEKILYSFPTAKQGYVPRGDLVFDSAGKLYGATMFGGGKGTTCNPYYQYCGAIFELSPPKTKDGEWAEKVLHRFAGGSDGAEPNGGLVLDGAGVVYGTTYFGGKETGDCNGGVGGTGCGTVFSLTPPIKTGGQWTESILHRFQGNQDADNPAAGVIFDHHGNLFGTTFFGPQNGFGTVFEVAKPAGKSHSWKETLLYRFTDGNDGGYPAAALSFDASGSLFGTASGGDNGGTVFRLKPPQREGGNWSLASLHNFAGIPDGIAPAAVVVFDETGNLYSTTPKGGTGTGCGFADCGAVFELSP